MGMRYIVAFEDVAVAAVQDLFEIAVPSTCAAILHSVKVSQRTEAGDAASEQLRFRIKHVTGAASSGSGGASVTAVALGASGATTRLTCERNNTTQLSGGTTRLSYSDCANVLGDGWHDLPIPEGRLEAGPSTYIVISLETAPADSITMSGYAVVEEVG